jgi:CheY-like chemotaxis protein
MSFSLIASSTYDTDKNRIILLVDDEEDILTLFCECLQSWGYQTISFDNPINALNYIDTDNNVSNCSLIITDYKMPQMNGIDFIKKIREKHIRCNSNNNNNNNNSQLKIMLISAFLKNDLDAQNIINNLKIDKVIEKPMRIEILKEEIQKLLDHSNIS